MTPRARSSATSAVYLAFSLLGASLFASLALGMLLVSITRAMNGDQDGTLQALWAMTGLGLMSASGVPVAYWALRGLLGRPVPHLGRPSPRWLATAVLFPLALALGAWAFGEGSALLILTPVAQGLAAVTPITFAALLALMAGSPVPVRRAWAQYLIGLWVMPPVALLLELLFLIPLLAAVAAAVSLDPTARGLFEQLRHAVSLPAGPDAQSLRALLARPGVAIPALAYVILLVPLIEEAVKTMALWPYLRRTRPGQAFIAGMLGGAGYALFEALFLTQPGPDWAATILGRAGASLMHMITAGISSWGLAEALRRRDWRPLLAAYLAAVLLHGTWNATAVGVAVMDLIQQAERATSPGAWLNSGRLAAVALMAALSLIAGMALPWMAHRTAAPEKEENEKEAAGAS